MSKIKKTTKQAIICIAAGLLAIVACFGLSKLLTVMVRAGHGWAVIAWAFIWGCEIIITLALIFAGGYVFIRAAKEENRYGKFSNKKGQA